LTELEAEQTITWYLQRSPQIPFAHPRIKITPDYVNGEGDATHSGGVGQWGSRRARSDSIEKENRQD